MQIEEKSGYRSMNRRRQRVARLAGLTTVIACVVVGTAGARTARIAAIPANTSLPTISGTAQEGQVLTATTGAWTGASPITYSQTWQRCTAAGGGCKNIGGANHATYTLQKTDIGSTLHVEVTAKNTGGTSSATSALTAVVTSTAAPANTALPTISGTAQEGEVLTATSGSWTGAAPITYTYLWQRCSSSGGQCANIGGANHTTYTLQKPDVAGTLRVEVTATDAGGANSATSALTPLVTGTAAPANTALPTISGTAQEGQVLTATTGTWTGTSPITYSQTWQRCNAAGGSCKTIGGANHTTYALQNADVGSTLRVEVTAKNAVDTASATSAPTAVVSLTPSTTVTLSTSTSKVVFGTGVTLSGAVSTKQAGVTITILEQPYGATASSTLTTVTTSTAGAWSYTTKPTIQTSYRAQLAAATSAAQTVAVAPLITFHVLTGHRFSTRALAGHSFAGRIVQFQRRSSYGQWVTLKRVRVAASAAVIFRATLPKGNSTLRIAMSVNQAGAGYLAGFSRTLIYHRG